MFSGRCGVERIRKRGKREKLREYIGGNRAGKTGKENKTSVVLVCLFFSLSLSFLRVLFVSV